MKPLTLLLLATLLITSCKHSYNGNYLAVKEVSGDVSFRAISPQYYRNDDVNAQLRSALVGKKFQVTFVDDYVTLSSINSKNYNDIILNKSVGEFGIEYFKGKRIINDVAFEFSLMANDTDYLLLAVDCTVKDAESFVIPAQLSGAILNNPIQGRALLQLNKVQ